MRADINDTEVSAPEDAILSVYSTSTTNKIFSPLSGQFTLPPRIRLLADSDGFFPSSTAASQHPCWILQFYFPLSYLAAIEDRSDFCEFRHFLLTDAFANNNDRCEDSPITHFSAWELEPVSLGGFTSGGDSEGGLDYRSDVNSPRIIAGKLPEAERSEKSVCVCNVWVVWRSESDRRKFMERKPGHGLLNLQRLNRDPAHFISEEPIWSAYGEGFWDPLKEWATEGYVEGDAYSYEEVTGPRSTANSW